MNETRHKAPVWAGKVLPIVDWLVLAASLALAGYGQALFEKGEPASAVGAMGLAMVLFAWGTRRVRVPEPATSPPAACPVGRARRALGVSLLLAAGACIAVSLVRFGTRPPDNVSWWLYLASMALLLLGFIALEWRPGATGVRAWLVRLQAGRWELAILLCILFLGGFLRFYGVDVFPFGVWFDESDNAVWAREILMRPDFRPLYVASTNLPAHFLYLIAFSFKLFGVNVGALRFVTAFFGTLTILAVWLLGREIGGRWVGLLAASLVAISHWCINFSRLGMHGITTPFFAALSAYLLLRGLRSGSRVTLALGGLALGLGLDFYAPFRLFPFIIVLFLLGKLIFERGFLPRGWQGAVIFIVASIIAFAPVGQYALMHREEFFARTAQTSIFTGKTHDQAIEALKISARKHLLMFNYQGDRNGRHNLPGEPMLDPIAGALLPLGLAFSLARLHRPRQLLLVSWFAVMLCAGIFSLDFEAPQSLRAIGVIPPVFLMIAQAVPAAGVGLLAPLRRSAPREGGAYRLAAGACTALVLAGLLYSGYLNYDVYFVRQPRHPEVYHAYNAREAMTARKVAAEGDKYIIYSIYVGHPTVRFLAPDAPAHRSFHPIDDLPVRGLVDRDVLYVMEPEFCPPPELFQFWYPQGKLTWYYDPGGNPMLFTYLVSKEEVNAKQGAWFRLFPASDEGDSVPMVEQRVDGLSARWDDLAGGAGGRGEWTGQLFVPSSGKYTFHLRSAGTAAFVLDDTPIQLPEGGDIDEERPMVKGWHPFRLVADRVEGGDVDVSWTLPDGARGAVPREALNVLPGLQHGLYGYYYQGLEWSGVPVFGRVDWQVNFRWHVQPLPTPFSVEWFGGLKVDEPGAYVLAIRSNSPALLELNGQVVIDSTAPPHGERHVVLRLDPGVYPIHLRYREPGGYTEIRLLWGAPGRAVEPIPSEHLVPAVPAGLGPSFALVPTPAPTPVETPPAHDVEEIPSSPADVVREVDLSGELDRPRYIAAGADGSLYITDVARRAVAVVDASGKVRDWWGEGELEDPADLALGEGGALYVIDAARSRVVRFAPSGKRDAQLGRDAGLYGALGLAVDPDGNLVLADTGSNRIVVLSPDGAVVRSFGTQGAGIGQLDQPIDVAVDPQGLIYTADTLLNKRVQVFSPAGVVVRQWAVPWASDFLAAALALHADGRVFMVDTDRARVWEYSPDGSEATWWTGGGMRRPVGIAVNADGHILVLDEETRRVYFFQR